MHCWSQNFDLVRNLLSCKFLAICSKSASASLYDFICESQVTVLEEYCYAASHSESSEAWPVSAEWRNLATCWFGRPGKGKVYCWAKALVTLHASNLGNETKSCNYDSGAGRYTKGTTGHLQRAETNTEQQWQVTEIACCTITSRCWRGCAVNLLLFKIV